MTNMLGVQKIQLLPMDKREEFKTEEDARKFLATELVQRDGKYYYRKSGIDIKNDENDLILFQYNSTIIGYGILLGREKIGLTDEETGVDYNGYLQFMTMSIHNVSNITLEEIQEIDGSITRFSNSKSFIDLNNITKVYDLLIQKQAEFAQCRL